MGLLGGSWGSGRRLVDLAKKERYGGEKNVFLTILGAFWGSRGIPRCSRNQKKKHVFFSYIFSHAFFWHVFSAVGPFSSPFSAIFSDFWTLGTPKNMKIRWEVLHFSEESLFLIFFEMFANFWNSAPFLVDFRQFWPHFWSPNHQKSRKMGPQNAVKNQPQNQPQKSVPKVSPNNITTLCGRCRRSAL